VPPKFDPAPTVTQLTGPAHDTPWREPTPDGALAWLQFDPLFVVLMMAAPPTAVHDIEVTQLMPTNVVPPGWAPRSAHAAPPFVV
jgi:hypothetical protein